MLDRFWILVISTVNHRDIKRNMLYYLVHLVGRLLRVRRVRDSCVMVFAFGVYVETKGTILPGDISYVPRAMPHIIHFDTSILHLLYLLHVYFLLPFIIYFLFYIFYSVDTSTPSVPSLWAHAREPFPTEPKTRGIGNILLGHSGGLFENTEIFAYHAYCNINIRTTNSTVDHNLIRYMGLCYKSAAYLLSLSRSWTTIYRTRLHRPYDVRIDFSSCYAPHVP